MRSACGSCGRAPFRKTEDDLIANLDFLNCNPERTEADPGGEVDLLLTVANHNDVAVAIQFQSHVGPESTTFFPTTIEAGEAPFIALTADMPEGDGWHPVEISFFDVSEASVSGGAYR